MYDAPCGGIGRYAYQLITKRTGTKGLSSPQTSVTLQRIAHLPLRSTCTPMRGICRGGPPPLGPARAAETEGDVCPRGGVGWGVGGPPQRRILCVN
eukprot:6777544-Prymnesium_polylepis.1